MKIIVSIILILLIFNIRNFAQYRPSFQKGALLIGADPAVGFGTGNSEYRHYDIKSFSLTPKVAFFIVDGLALGIVADLTSTDYMEYYSNETYTEFTIGPVMRYYVPEWPLFFHFDLTFGKMIEEFYAVSGKNTNVRKLKVGLGYALFLSRSIAIEPGLYYQNANHKTKSDLGSLELPINEFVVAVGLTVFLNKKSK